MKVFAALVLCTLFLSAYTATVADVYEGPTYDSDGLIIQDAASSLLDDDITKSSEPAREEIEDNNDGHGFRVRRFACDVLSFKSKWLSPNHSACAVRCLAQRRRGGKCVNGICKCRGKKWGK